MICGCSSVPCCDITELLSVTAAAGPPAEGKLSCANAVRGKTSEISSPDRKTDTTRIAFFTDFFIMLLLFNKTLQFSLSDIFVAVCISSR
ncbi:MAG TPA: hypothetical protein IAB39_05965 [Candidatus Onthovicinus excrementipullorum]|nr:hypothetical protein [Candidatus Onthovicinus excrementipullorum]